jgi:FkbM family methyltransferase
MKLPIKGTDYEVEAIGDTARFIDDLINNGEYRLNTCLDVGANVGLFSIWANKFFKTIYAVEANPNTYSVLEQNIKNNNLTNVKIFNKAICGDNKMRRISNDQSDGGNRLVGDNEGVEVEGVTLAKFILDNEIEHIDLLKIDIEDGETEVFNSPDFLDIADRISLITGEHYNNIQSSLANAGFKLVERTDKHGFYAYR